MTSADRRANQDKLEELERDRATTVDVEADARQWTSLHAAAEPALDAAGGPILRINDGGEVTSVGIARSNILSIGRVRVRDRAGESTLARRIQILRHAQNSASRCGKRPDVAATTAWVTAAKNGEHRRRNAKDRILQRKPPSRAAPPQFDPSLRHDHRDGHRVLQGNEKSIDGNLVSSRRSRRSSFIVSGAVRDLIPSICT